MLEYRLTRAMSSYDTVDIYPFSSKKYILDYINIYWPRRYRQINKELKQPSLNTDMKEK
jgi:hypothetical protein